MSNNDFRRSSEPVAESLEDALPNAGAVLPLWVFCKAVEQLTMAACITDIGAKMLYANAAFTDITGYALSELIGKNASLLSHKCTPSRVYEQMWDRLSQQKSWTGLIVNRRKQGNVYLAELTVAPLLNELSETAYYLGIHRDVTALHRLEQQVLNQKALIESMVDAAPAVIALLDENGRVILDNHEYKKLVGDMRGREPAAEFLRALRESMGESFHHAYRVGQGFQDREVSFEPGGSGETRWFSCSGTWFRERDSSADAFFKPVKQTYLLLMANEITHLKRQHEAVGMNAMRALLAEQERVRSMRDTLEAAIFQMQGPVNLITAASEMLERRGNSYSDNTAQRNVLRQAVTASREALAKLQASMPEVPMEAVAPVNINQLLREVLTLSTQRLLAGGMVVDWKPAPMLPAVPARAGRLRAMFKQLVDNALDAMESNRLKSRELRIVTGAQKDGVLVTIEDTGPGVPKHLRLKIFEPFFSSKSATNRTGMGLPMVQDVVNEHRGMISIDPDYAEGCRFRVLLPIKG